MSEPIPALLPCAALFLASAATLLALARTVLPAPPEPVAGGRHRRTARPLPYRTVARSHRPEEGPLAGEATRAVRPYVVAAEQAARRWEREFAVLVLDGPGPYVRHGVEAA
ncbi:hypothetical protein [Streptomyces hirsutus]|uniref:hypothetical protein n=1 Tax=Streptomyces hirsutus TaxID=35620 RepID=UPI0006E1B300|nr:hypothetical protein [Streptomyces hirsutus]